MSLQGIVFCALTFGLYPTFSSIESRISNFMLRSLIHLDLSFVQDNRHVSIWILLYASIQLDQHHLLTMLSVQMWVFLTSLSKNRCLQMCEFKPGSSILFHWVHVFFHNTMLFLFLWLQEQLETIDSETSHSSFIIQDSFSYPVFFFTYKPQNCPFKIREELHYNYNFGVDCIEFEYCFSVGVHFYYINPTDPWP